jgi:hypothetical protein
MNKRIILLGVAATFISLSATYLHAAQKVTLSYTVKESLSNSQLEFAAMMAKGRTSPIGCAVFRKDVHEGEGQWLSLQILQNHVWMVLTAPRQVRPMRDKAELYVGNNKIVRPVRDEHLTTYYLAASDFKQMLGGQDLKILPSGADVLVRHEELAKIDSVLSDCTQ